MISSDFIHYDKKYNKRHKIIIVIIALLCIAVQYLPYKVLAANDEVDHLECVEALQKVEGNPIISIGINESWGKCSYAVTGITPLYCHDGYKVENNPCIFEINAEAYSIIG